MAYVITCGDEGVQINEGRKLGVLGAGLKLADFPQVVKILTKIFPQPIYLAANQENEWVKEQFNLKNFEQTNATFQQQLASLADELNLTYAGYLPFSDPKQLQDGVRGHMVRPQKIHIANKICLTLGGGEQTYNLGHYVVSADWVHKAKPELVKSFLQTQIDFYTKLNKGEKLTIVCEEAGELGETIAAKNKAVLQELGFIN